MVMQLFEQGLASINPDRGKMFLAPKRFSRTADIEPEMLRATRKSASPEIRVATPLTVYRYCGKPSEACPLPRES